jgi:hypothetical protein
MVATVVLLLSAAVAQAASGQITRAEANPDWTLGSVAAHAEWPHCEHANPYSGPGPGPSRPVPLTPPGPPPCTWIPYATAGSGECAGADRSWPELGDGITLVWKGDEEVGAGKAAFDVTGVPLTGAPEQLVCLSLIEIVPPGPCMSEPCGPQGPPLRFDHQLASMPMMAVGTLPIAPADPAVGTLPIVPDPAHGAVLLHRRKACAGARRADRRHHRARHRHHRHRCRSSATRN